MFEEQKNRSDIFEGFEEPIIIHKEVKDLEPKKRQPYTDLRTRREKNILKSVSSLEITRKGNLRSDSEMLGIRKKKIEARKKKKKEVHLLRKDADKKLFLARRRGIEVVAEKTKTSTAEWKAAERERKKRAKATLLANKYSKSQKNDFREMKNKMRRDKKKKKKERQAARKSALKKVSTEAGYLDLETKEDIYGYDKMNGINVYKEGFHYVHHDTMEDFSMGKEFVKEMYKLFGDALRENKDYITILLYVHQMALSQSLQMDISLTTTFAMNFSKHDIALAMASGGLVINAFKRRSRAQIVTESFSEPLYNMSSMLKTLVECSLVEALKHIVLVALSWKLFSKDMSDDIKKYFGPTALKKMTLVDTFTYILDSVAALLSVAEAVYQGVPLSEALFSGDPLKHAIAKSDNLLAFRNNLYYGLPHEDKMCARKFMTETASLVSLLEHYKNNTNPFTGKYKIINEKLINLLAVRTNIKTLMERDVRAPPFAIIIFGDSGVGKSAFTNYTYQLFSDVKGREFFQTLVHEKVATSPYWDQYDPNAHPYLHISEAGNLCVNLAKARGDDMVREFTSICDSLPYALDMSKAEDKGTVYCNPELVVFDTNNPGLNLEYTVNNPAAYRRRFVYIEVTVKPEYRKQNSTALDPTKESENFYDKWYFRVTTKEPIDLKNSAEIAHLEKGDIMQLEPVLRKLMVDHIVTGEAYVANRREKINFNHVQAESGHLQESEYCKPVVDYISTTSKRVVYSSTRYLSCQVKRASCYCMESEYSYRMFTFILLMSYYFGIFPYVFIFLINMFFELDIYNKGKEKIRHELSDMRNRMSIEIRHESDRAIEAVNDTIRYYKGETFKLGKYFALSLTLIAGLSSLLKFISRIKPKTESSFFQVPSEPNQELNKVENEYKCGESYERVNVNKTKTWNVRVVKPSVHRGDISDLFRLVSRNSRFCHIIRQNKQALTTYCMGVSGNYALINRHAFGQMKEPVILKVATRGMTRELDVFHMTEIRPCDIVEICSDIAMIELNSISFKDITSHFPDEIVDFKNANSIIDGNKTLVRSSYDTMLKVSDPELGTLEFDRVVTYDWKDHKIGKCGLPIVGERTKGSCILGLHSAGTQGEGTSYGITVTTGDIARGISCLKKNGLAPIFSEAAILYGVTPHPKSPIRYEDLGPVEYFGCISQPNMNQKSKLQRTIFSKDLPELFYNNIGFIRSKIHRKPLMKPMGTGDKFQSPWNAGLRKICRQKGYLSKGRIIKCINIATAQINGNLDKMDIPSINPLTVEAAVNGLLHDPFIRRMDMNKAAGFGTPGKKSEYAVRYEHENYVRDDITDEIVSEVLNIIKTLKSGHNYNVVYNGNCKDEPVVKKTRIFFASPLAFLIVTRMFLGPLYSLFLEKGEAFYTGIGLDMHRDAHTLLKNLSDFSDKFLEGDYGGYDTSMEFLFGRAANTICLNILSKLGYDSDQLLIVAGILSSNMFPTIMLIGELLRVPGLQPSGKLGTAEDNSLRNLVICIYMYITITGREDFFENVLPVTYGDDVIMALKDDIVDVFNAMSFKDACEEHTSMTFTSASKEDIQVPFLLWNEISFLKRTFQPHSVLQRIVAVLDKHSMYKTLEWYLRSDNVNEATQYEMICASSLREIYLYDDRDAFTAFRSYMMKTLEEHHKECIFTLPTWAEITDSLWLDAMIVHSGRQSHESITASTESGVIGNVALLKNSKPLSPFSRGFNCNQWLAENRQKIEDDIAFIEVELKSCDLELRKLSNPFPGYSYRQVKQMQLYNGNNDIRAQCDKYFAIANKIRRLTLTKERLWNWLQRTKTVRLIVTESGELGDGSLADEVKEVHENVHDYGGDVAHIVDTGKVPRYMGNDHSLRLDDFLKRPLAIAQAELEVGDNLSLRLDAWDLYLSHPSVRAKLRNYSAFRGTLHLRIQGVASPFVYTKIQCSYQPLAILNQTLGSYYRDIQVGAGRILPLCYLSQARGCTTMDINSSKPLEVECPFISPQPMMRLYNNTTSILGENDSYNDAIGFGMMYINSISPLRAASDGTTGASIFVYAWMEDVELGPPTGTVLEIATESGKDEREVGPIQKFATRASEVTNMLSAVPVIAPFAKASTIMFEEMGSLASLFGFSVPTMNSEPCRVKNDAFQNGSQVIGYDTGKRITLDPKQELTIDPRVCGSQEDEMSIAYLASCEGLIDVLDWDSDAGSLSVPLWTVPVTPGLHPYFVEGQPTPLSFCATPFKVWHGDITFRFEINASNYHRGKLAVFHEPNMMQTNVINAVLDLNKQHVRIIDIQEIRDFSVTVKWTLPRHWAEVKLTNALQNYVPDFYGANGYISIVPFTTLQSPNGSPISINVYISSDNIVFNHLTTVNMPRRMPNTEAGIVSTPNEVTHMELNASNVSTEHLCEDYYGERPISFRSLLKRFTGWTRAEDFLIQDNGGASLYALYCHPIYPTPYPKYGEISLEQEPNLFGYLRYAYIGMKGGMRHRVGVSGRMTFNQMGRVKVELGEPKEQFDVFHQFILSDTVRRLNSTMNGTIQFAPTTNSGIEYETPCYTSNLFAISFSDDPYPFSSLIQTKNVRDVDVVMTHNTILTDRSYVMHDIATAEDFSFLRFQGAPPYAIPF